MLQRLARFLPSTHLPNAPRVTPFSKADDYVLPQSALILFATLLALTAIGQASDGLGSKVLSEWGGDLLNTAWAVAAVLSAFLVWIALCFRNPHDASVPEFWGIFLFVVDVAIYIIAVKEERGFEGNLIPLTLLAGIGVLAIGRAALLVVRRVWVQLVTR